MGISLSLMEWQGDLETESVRPRSVGSRKLAVEIVSEIEAEIMRAGWPVGDIIGTFAELIERYGVSRAVIRESVGLLEHRKIVRMRHGPGGGVEVRAPVGAAVVGAVSSYFDFIGVSDDEIKDMRHVLLGLAARLAAERIDEDGVRRLREVVHTEAKFDPEHPRPGLDFMDFFREVSELSKNPALALFLLALGQRTFDFPEDFVPPPDWVDSIRASHEEIVNAIVGRDSSGAEAKMLEHTRAAYSRQVEFAPAADPTHYGVEVPAVAIANDRHGKLPVRVARFIKREILEKNLKPGAVVGFERDLLQSFSVSRSVFREAVRIVEYYGLAEMRRGPKGGLTVCEPDPKQMEETVISYLEYMKIELRHLAEVRTGVELLNIRWAIERNDSELRDLVEIVDKEPIPTELQRMFGLHQRLSELSGNRASGFIANVLARLIDRHVDFQSINHDMTSDQATAANIRAHQEHAAVAEAILARDEALACHRMLQHLEFVNTMMSKAETNS